MWEGILFRYFRIADHPPRPPRNALTELNDRIVLKSPIERSEYAHLAWWVAVLQERKSCGARKWASGAQGMVDTPNGESASRPRIPSAQSLDLGDQLRNARGPDFVVCAAGFVFG
jgi:hypothetical protein